MEAPPIRILIYDDDPAEYELVRTCLQQITDRATVLLEVGHTEEMQDALDISAIDLVLTANGVPRRARMERAARIVRSQFAPVFIFTDSGTEAAATQLFQDGVVAYVPKASLSPEKLKDLIDVALDRCSRLQQAKAKNEELERLATFDLLTGVYNRRAILDKLPELLNLANRYKEDFSLILLDIDDFKTLTDRYGHLTEDKVLERIATLVRGNIRNTDIAGRYAAAQFMILLPKANLSSSWVAAERLRSLIEATEFKDSAKNVFAVTLSEGLVGWERNDDATSLISRAEKALYKAKEKGRNRVQILLGPTLRDKV
jgi:diguanylate cyclase (GGDEF)-like protein